MYICRYISVCFYIHTHKYIYMRICICVCMYICMYVYVYICSYIYIEISQMVTSGDVAEWVETVCGNQEVMSSNPGI
jgi:hypothetical protein